jgi:hypothetical protein
LYSIEIDYTASDSFASWDRTEEVGMNWERLDKAQLALSWLHEHREAMIQYHNDSRSQSPKDFFDVNTIKDKPWFYPGLNGDLSRHDWEHTLLIERDDGEVAGIQVFWIGHFEKTHNVRLVVTKNPEKEAEDIRIYDEPFTA